MWEDGGGDPASYPILALEVTKHVVPFLGVQRSAAEMLKFVESHGLEGAMAKRADCGISNK